MCVLISHLHKLGSYHQDYFSSLSSFQIAIREKQQQKQM